MAKLIYLVEVIDLDRLKDLRFAEIYEQFSETDIIITNIYKFPVLKLIFKPYAAYLWELGDEGRCVDKYNSSDVFTQHCITSIFNHVKIYDQHRSKKNKGLDLKWIDLNI